MQLIHLLNFKQILQSCQCLKCRIMGFGIIKIPSFIKKKLLLNISPLMGNNRTDSNIIIPDYHKKMKYYLKKSSYSIIILFGFFMSSPIAKIFAQKVNDFPRKSDPLHKKIAMHDRLMLGNHWNEGAIMQHVIFPPAGLDRPIIGSTADCLDPTSEMLAA